MTDLKEIYKTFSALGIDLKNVSPAKAHQLIARVESLDIMNTGYVSDAALNELLGILGVKTTRAESEQADNNQIRTNLLTARTSNRLKIGRNDPCLCGSKKKYKKCCGEIG